MNSNFNDEQIVAYAAAFEAGDAIWCDGKWWEVEDDNRGNALLTNAPNQYLLKSYNGITLISGFYEDDELKSPYRITTLQDYELQGGEKLVWLGGNGAMLGEVLETFVDDYGNVVYEGESGFVRPSNRNWSVIPRYEQVKHSVDPTKKKPKFKVGDIVTVKTYKAPATVKEVEESTMPETYIYSVEYNGDKSMKFWESDLELYRQEEEEGRPASSHYHDNNNGNDVWQFADDNLSDERVKGFHQINAIKYVSRYHKKHDTIEKRIEDLEKAKVSIDKLIELEKKG